MNQEPSETNNARKNYFNWPIFYRFGIGSFVMRLLMELFARKLSGRRMGGRVLRQY
jgi:hypothetical protein